MHILMLILKIIGIILLVLLGIVLLLVLLLIFVPFCYRVEGSYYEDKPYVMARVRYLFPLLQVFIRYKDGEAEGKVKVFGISVYDLFAPKEPKEKAEKPKAKESAPEARNDIQETGAVPDNELLPDVAEETETVKGSEQEQETDSETISFFEKIRRFILVIREKIRTFVEKLRQIKEKGIRLKQKAEEIAEKLKYYYEIWQREETQRAFQTAKKSLYKLWKSIRPKKGLAKLHIGTGDPGNTGQICGYFGMMYPFLGKYVMIEPDFENKIYEGNFYFKGRITVFAFLKVAWVVLFDKDIKKLRKILTN